MFNPVLVSPTFKIENSALSKEEIDVYIVSELLEELKNIRLEISVQRFDSLKQTHQQNVMIDSVDPYSARAYFNFSMSEALNNGNCKSADGISRFSYCFLTFRLLNLDGELLSENKMMPYPKDTIGLQNPNLVVSSVSYCTQCENTGYLGQISIECINVCKPRKKLFKNGLSTINNPYKQ